MTTRSASYLIERLQQHTCSHADLDKARLKLIGLLNRVPDQSIGPDTDVIVREDGTLVFLIKHANDHLRFVQLFFTAENLFVNVCFMKDSMLHQYAKSVGRLSFESFAERYLEAVLGSAFEKKIVYRGKEVFECELRFDHEQLPNKLYISRKNRLRKFFLGAPKKQVEAYRYLSFFETYDYTIENVLMDRP